MEQIILAGTPQATELSGTQPQTTEPAPITTLFPIVVFGSIVVFAPIKTLEPIFTPPLLKDRRGGLKSCHVLILLRYVIIPHYLQFQSYKGN